MPWDAGVRPRLPSVIRLGRRSREAGTHKRVSFWARDHIPHALGLWYKQKGPQPSLVIGWASERGLNGETHRDTSSRCREVLDRAGLGVVARDCVRADIVTNSL